MSISTAQQIANEERRAAARRQHINTLRDNLIETEVRLRNSRRAAAAGDSVLGAKIEPLEQMLAEDRRLLLEAESAFAEMCE